MASEPAAAPAPEAPAAAAPAAAPQQRAPRRQSFLDEEEPAAAPVVERRRQDSLLAEIERAAGKGGRRIDDLRAEVQRATTTDGERGPARPRGRLGGALRPSRILLIVVALFAGGTAAFLAFNREPPPVASPTEADIVAAPAPPPVAASRVLVAKTAIGMGERLTPETVEWQDWPTNAVRPEYITIAAEPEAIADMSDAVVRYEFFAGEPIRAQKIVRADQGYLSAVLSPGMRGVSVTISSESASGGFILPNDHVDVVLTRATDTGQDSETILRNVRVLAINARLGETGASGAPADPANPKAEVFVHEAIATLELDPSQAEVIINSTQMGRLSLTLRAMTDAAEKEREAEKAANQAIRLSSKFWTN